MGVTIDVEPGGLQRAADCLSALVWSMRALRSRLAGILVLRDPWMAGGLAQVEAAYATVAAFLGDDLDLLARRIGEAGVSYRLTDDTIAAGCPP
jgi:hypothetical protein